jgi:hypothetical protein
MRPFSEQMLEHGVCYSVHKHESNGERTRLAQLRVKLNDCSPNVAVESTAVLSRIPRVSGSTTERIQLSSFGNLCFTDAGPSGRAV